VLRTWRKTGKRRHGRSEIYVRKHWYEVTSALDSTMRPYLSGQLRGGRKGERWLLSSIRDPEESSMNYLTESFEDFDP
jgi:hypothetical protein